MLNHRQRPIGFSSRWQLLLTRAQSEKNVPGTGRRKREILPIFTSLVLCSGFSIKEVVELRDLGIFNIGVAHGLCLSAWNRFIRSLTNLQTQVDEFNEGIEKLVETEWRIVT